MLAQDVSRKVTRILFKKQRYRTEEDGQELCTLLGREVESALRGQGLPAWQRAVEEMLIVSKLLCLEEGKVLPEEDGIYVLVRGRIEMRRF